MLLSEHSQQQIARKFDEPLKFALDKVKEAFPKFSDEQKTSLAVISVYKFQKYLAQKVELESKNMLEIINAQRAEEGEPGVGLATARRMYMNQNLTPFETRLLYDFRVVTTPRYSKDDPGKQVEFMVGNGPYEHFGLDAVHSSYLYKKYDQSKPEYDYQEPDVNFKMTQGEKDVISFLVDQTGYKLEKYSDISDSMHLWMSVQDNAEKKPGSIREDRLWLDDKFDKFAQERWEFARLKVNEHTMYAIDSLLENNMDRESKVFSKMLANDMDIVKRDNIWD